MHLIDSFPRPLFPTRRRGLRWLRGELVRLGVRAPLSPGCLADFVANAATAAVRERTSSETYASSLRRQLDAQAQFIHLWTTSDDRLARPEWSDWIEIARRHLLPRSWKIQESTVTETRRDESFKVPERLVVKGTAGARPQRPLTSANDLPGTQILSDLKRASDKS
jgi:hypothetical protein